MELDVEQARRALEANPGQAEAWHELGLALAAAGDGAGLLALADLAAGPFRDAVIFAHNVIKDLALRGRWDAVRRLAAILPPQRREHALALYYSGCAEVAAGDHVAALDRFHAFQQSVLPRAAEFPLGDPAFNLIFRQGVLVEPLPLVRGLAVMPLPSTPPLTFVGDGAAGPFPFVLLHVLDTRYFHRFAAELCAGHAAAGLVVPLHFHVAAADETVPEVFGQLRRAHPALRLGLSVEPRGPWDGPVYYTCARFMIMSHLLDRYGCPVLASDADILPVTPAATLFAAAAGADFACFETGRTEPASVYQASIMVFDSGARSRALTADLTRFCALKLGMPQALSWMLDQAGLFSLLTQRRADDPGFRFQALDRALGMPLDQATRQLSSDAEKLSLMSGN